MNQIAFETELGYMGLALRDSALLALVFGHSSERAALRALAARVHKSPLTREARCDAEFDLDDLVDRLRELALGVPTDLSDVPVDMRDATPFQRRVIEACRAIRWGETRTYGQLAASAGRPGAARAVGAVMAANRLPLVVPCHRVVAAAGGLGGFSAPQGLAMKRRLLAAERPLHEQVTARRTLAAMP
jgi:methylated-DNA-[protein]-cysteine S-methyltransferase